MSSKVMSDLRCPVDSKLLFQYDDEGTLYIKCRGRCAHCWIVSVIDGKPVVTAEADS